MITMFKQFFTMFSVLFMAGEKSAAALNNLASWCEASSAAFADEARIERQKRMKLLKAELKETPKLEAVKEAVQE